MGTLEIFGWGLLGGGLVEIIRLYEILKVVVVFYYSKKLLLVTCLLALGGGAVTVAFYISYPYISNPFVSILIGAATPTIISKAPAIISKILAKKIP